MAKVTAQEIMDMGFGFEMFGKDDDDALEAMIEAVIAEQAGLLEGRVGSTAYADTTTPNATYVKRAEKCLVAAEMVQARIIHMAGNAVPEGEEPNTLSLDRQKKKYLDEAQGLIDRVVAGAEADAAGFSTGTVISEGLGRTDFLTLYG